MAKKRTSHKTRAVRPRALASGIAVFCLHDEIVPADTLEPFPGGNYRLHKPAQLDRFEEVVKGNGWRRSIILSGNHIVRGHGAWQMAKRRGWSVPIERQVYRNRGEEIRDLIADNRLAEMAENDDVALRRLLGELDAGDLTLSAVTQEELDSLIAKLDPASAKLTPLAIQPTPKLAWVLIGIPLVDFGKINTHIEAIAALPGTIVENTLGSEPDPAP
jgi:hypothetical protein